MLRAIFSLLLFIPLFLSAQIWCPPNASWKWNTSSFEREGRTERNYVGDTLIDGRTAQRIHVTGFTVNTIGTADTLLFDQYRYTSTETDMVLVWSIWNGPVEWDTLYWFGAVPGDRWYAPGDDGECGPYPAGMHQVMDTATVIIDGLSLRELSLVAIDELGTPSGDTLTLTERIGLTNGSFNFLSGCIPTSVTETLLCYTDEGINLVTPAGELSCSSLVGILPLDDDLLIHLFPNPGSESFTVQLPFGPYQVDVIDQNGRLVSHGTVIGGSSKVDTQLLAPGVYFIRATNAQGVRSYTHWVKQ